MGLCRLEQFHIQIHADTFGKQFTNLRIIDHPRSMTSSSATKRSPSPTPVSASRTTLNPPPRSGNGNNVAKKPVT